MLPKPTGTPPPPPGLQGSPLLMKLQVSVSKRLRGLSQLLWGSLAEPVLLARPFWGTCSGDPWFRNRGASAPLVLVLPAVAEPRDPGRRIWIPQASASRVEAGGQLSSKSITKSRPTDKWERRETGGPLRRKQETQLPALQPRLSQL